MSSRLFQKIREESGMALHRLQLPATPTPIAGMLSVYAATNPDAALRGAAVSCSRRPASWPTGGLTRDEFTMAREQLKASYILGLESTSARMQSNGRRLLLLNSTRTETEVIDRVNAIGFDETNALMREILTAPHSMALVGKGVERVAKEIEN